MNPLDLHGPEFLGLYILLMLLVGVCAFGCREMMRNVSSPGDWRTEKLHPYEMAYLADGPARAVHAAIFALVHRGVLRLEESENALYRSAPLSAGSHKLESVIVDAVDPNVGRSVRKLVDDVEFSASKLGKRLEELGLLLDPAQAAKALTLPTLLCLAVPLFGAVKVFVGLSRNRPVEILVVLCIASVVLAFLIFSRKAFRSRAGDEALNSLKSDHAALKTTVRSAPTRLESGDLGLVVALFGVSVMVSGYYASLSKALIPPPVAADSGSYLWTGCGSTGCGGGGGGCGGGGCGGCGGG